jgi:hypothetical protein
MKSGVVRRADEVIEMTMLFVAVHESGQARNGPIGRV